MLRSQEESPLPLTKELKSPSGVEQVGDDEDASAPGGKRVNELVNEQVNELHDHAT